VSIYHCPFFLMQRVAARVWRRVGMCLAFVPQGSLGKPRPAVCVTTCNVNITPSGQQAYLREPSTQNSVAAKFITQLPQIPLQPALRGLSFARASMPTRRHAHLHALHTSTPSRHFVPPILLLASVATKAKHQTIDIRREDDFVADSAMGPVLGLSTSQLYLIRQAGGSSSGHRFGLNLSRRSFEGIQGSSGLAAPELERSPPLYLFL